MSAPPQVEQAPEVEQAPTVADYFRGRLDDITAAHQDGDRSVLNDVFLEFMLMSLIVAEEGDLVMARRLSAIAVAEADAYLSPEDMPPLYPPVGIEDSHLNAVVTEVRLRNILMDQVRRVACRANDLDTLARLARTAVAEILAYGPAHVQRPEVRF